MVESIAANRRRTKTLRTCEKRASLRSIFLECLCRKRAHEQSLALIYHMC